MTFYDIVLVEYLISTKLMLHIHIGVQLSNVAHTPPVFSTL